MTKPISPRLSALLASDSDLFIADVYEFTLIGGTVSRYTNADRDLTVNGKVYSAGGIQIGPYFDINGNLKKQRIFLPTFGDTRRGPVTLFTGRVAEVDVGRSKATFTINDFMELLDQDFPRNLYQAGCVNNLGDTACGVNLNALAVACTDAGGSTVSTINANLAVAPTGQFNQGKVTFTSGVLNGVSRSVKLATAGAPGVITLLMSLPSAPTIGDTFNIYPGCDKTFAGTNGCPKFANTARWRGEDRIPIVETAI